MHDERLFVRIDRWLWAARLFKTRSLASAACTAGHVKLGGQAVKPARPVKRGDHLEVLAPGGLRILDVANLAQSRGPASVARLLYEDLTPPPPPQEDELVPSILRERGLGRPGKRDRRALRRLRGRY